MAVGFSVRKAKMLGRSLVPAGGIQIFGGSTAPDGFLLCDGTAVSRTTYADLFTVLGTSYGVGDGSTTFNLPNLQQRFPMGKASSGTGSTLGGTGGAIDHTHTVPAHYHAMGTGADLAVAINPNGNVYRGVVGTSSHAVAAGSDFKYETLGTTITGRIGLVTGGVDGNAAMTSGAQNPPYQVVNFIIKF